MKLYIKESGTNGFNAGFKARTDVDLLLEERGYSPVLIKLFAPGTSRFLIIFRRLIETFRNRNRIAASDELVLQYPLYTYHKKLRLFNYLLGRFKGSLTVLIHDISGYRDGLGIDENLKALLAFNPKIIAHTSAMARRIEADGDLEPGSVKVLNLFDYRTNTENTSFSQDGNTVIFAGNLKECGFLSRLDEIKGLDFNIYGVKSANVRESEHCHYCGKFSPDDVSVIQGDWGLVWHGHSLETSAGSIGEYLRIISSHKISLYIAAGKPVILWKESSVADFITANHLGIAVDSLFEVPEAIASLSASDKEMMRQSIKRFSEKLRKGEMLGALI